MHMKIDLVGQAAPSRKTRASLLNEQRSEPVRISRTMASRPASAKNFTLVPIADVGHLIDDEYSGARVRIQKLAHLAQEPMVIIDGSPVRKRMLAGGAPS